MMINGARLFAVRIFFFAAVLLLGSCRAPFQAEQLSGPQITFEVDVTNPTDDLFHVAVSTKNLTSENSIYNFASTAPGTYSILDFGRFVKSFKAFDKTGTPIPVEKISTNKWKIADPERLSLLQYDIEDSFDAKVSENSVHPMSGSGIDTNYAAFNTFSVLGYFQGLQSSPVRMKVHYKSGWMIGTALDVDDEGYYVAETYDRLADSPVLAGKLSFARTRVKDIDVDVYVYAVDTTISAKKVLTLANDVLQSAGDFIGFSPVPYYKFLFVLLDGPTFQRYGLTSAGALEHSYSSIYVLPVSPEGVGQLQSTMAHEFMHILTPLNLHSEIIHSYNFAVPTPSEHLWLYEGVTEWVSDIMQLRSGLITTEEFLAQISEKLDVNDGFNKEMSLTEMARNVYTPEGGSQFGNIYNRGAVTAAMLDIRLLELSNGKRGLREVFLDLLDQYGKKRPFPEKNFFDVLTAETYPEIGQFINDYIRGSKPLPAEEYMAKIGFRYYASKPDSTHPAMGVSLELDSAQNIVMSAVNDETKQFGLQEGDIIVKLMGSELNVQNAQQMFARIATMKVGDPYEVVVHRGGKERTVNAKLIRRIQRHVFEGMGTLTDRQEFLRERWMKNL
jgi:predicted metalloprotease with PDZ domain